MLLFALEARITNVSRYTAERVAVRGTDQLTESGKQQLYCLKNLSLTNEIKLIDLENFLSNNNVRMSPVEADKKIRLNRPQ